MTYAFYFDSAYCTGCKACQVACKDKNHLPIGVLWRRVYEISGGSWQNVGVGSPTPGAGEPSPYPVWQTDVFAYNLTLACNHCEHPVCAGVCPTQAYSKREDGLVLLDTAKCVGCQYCSWACPYGAPQYDVDAGHMTKCNFCADSLEVGQPPACVAACPMRTLDFGQRVDLEARPGVLPAVYPMSQTASRDPNILIKPHAQTEKALRAGASIANLEEVQPRSTRSPETPLIAFTLLAQMAIGAFWAVTLILFGLPYHYLGEQNILGPMWAVGSLIAIALAASLFHLGAPKKAWRALSHLRKSWLSREILSMLAFAGLWLLTLFLWMQPYGDIIYSNTLFLRNILAIVTALTGAAGIYNMAHVYRLKTVPAWCNWRIMVGFFVTAFLLGQLLTASFLAADELRGSPVSSYAALLAQTGVGLALLLGIQFWLVMSGGQSADVTVHRLRLGLIGAGMLGAVAMSIAVEKAGAWIMFPIFLVILVEEIMGRWLFYRLRQ